MHGSKELQVTHVRGSIFLYFVLLSREMGITDVIHGGLDVMCNVYKFLRVAVLSAVQTVTV